ncbi:MarR family winged helix-turn-helix transcriptional regulator [Streptomyces sp. M-16]|uniref:MarR family winged helix-turn-helix transcriptional regulator n=1 Tax=Streptomyces sp. M-16 TaxID=3233040 RepID=UPI00224C8EB7
MHTDLQLLGRAVKQAQYRNHRALDTALAAVGTTLAQWDALRAISRSPGASARELAAATFQSEQAFGTLVGRLTKQGVVERSPGRGRRIDHHLTPAGEHLLAAGGEAADQVLAANFAALAEPDRATLLALLQRLNGEEEPGAGAPTAV